ncbi:hypothetical protein F511_02445 [Dorcoceras hygrometricum]|nr:hypothetical protein F511_02445 [Dorcoceras hygrometricum]
MQYKFFPTDFLFPLQQSAAATGGGDGPSQPVLPVRSTRDLGVSEASKQLPKSLAMTNGKIVKPIPSSSSPTTRS